MSMVGQLAVGIVGDLTGMKKSFDTAGKSLDSFASKMKAAGDKIANTGKQMTTFVTLPILGIGAAFIKAASDAEEVNSKFDTVFKDQADAVREWAAEFSDATGRANVDNLKFLASVQDMFVPLGLARDAAADLSKSVVTLATDLGSFNNLNTEDVLRDIQSALVGNHETVRKYGVIIDAATIEQELFNMGVEEGAEGATAAEKALARYNLIVQGTADAQGDAVRTAGSFTNQFRALQSSTKDLAEGFGQLLLPLATDLVSKLKELVDKVMDLDQATRTAIFAAVGVVAAIGPALVIVGKLTTAVAGLSTALTYLAGHPILVATAAVAGLVTAWATAQEGLTSIGQYIHEFFIDLGNSLIAIWNGWVGAVEWAVNGIIAALNLIPGVNIASAQFGRMGNLESLEVTATLDPEDAVGDVVEAVETSQNAITGAVSDAETGIADSLDTVEDGMIAGIGSKLGDLGLAIEEGRVLSAEETAEGFRSLEAVMKDVEANTKKAESWGTELNEIKNDLDSLYPQIQADFNRAQAAYQVALDQRDATRQALDEAIAANETNLEAYQWAVLDAEEQMTIAAEQLQIARDEATAFEEADSRRVEYENALEELVGQIEEDTQTAAEQAIEQRKALAGLDVSLGDGFFKVSNSLSDGITQVGLDLGNVQVGITDGLLDLQINIGDSVISVRDAILVLQTMTATQTAVIAAGILTAVGAILTALAPLIILAVAIMAIVKIFQIIGSLFGKKNEAEAIQVPEFQWGGVVPGQIGEPRLILAHGGEPVGARGFEQVLDYERLGQAVAAGMYDAMSEMRQGSGQGGGNIVLQVNQRELGRAALDGIMLEGQRRGVVIVPA